MIEQGTLWTVIIALGIGTYLLRFAFLGFVGARPLPEWLMRHLRYTAVAILPALVAPLVVFGGQNGATEPDRLIAALVTLVIGVLTRSLMMGFGAGLITLAAVSWALGL